MSIVRSGRPVNRRRLLSGDGQRAPRPTRRQGFTCGGCGGRAFLWCESPVTALPSLVCWNCTAWTLAPKGESPSAVPAVADVPAPLQLRRPSEQAVFKIVRAGNGLLPKAIFAEYLGRVDVHAGISTVDHALASLRRAGFIRREPRGWVACSPKGGA